MANFSLGGAARAIGDYRARCRSSAPTFDLTDGARAVEHFGLAGAASVLTRGHLAWSLAELGEFPEAVERAEEAIRLAQAPTMPSVKLTRSSRSAASCCGRGDWPRRFPVLERGLALTKDAPFLFAPTAGDLGVIYALSGRADAGVELAERAVAQAERMGRLGRLSLLVTHLGEAYFFSGRRADAARAGRASARAGDRARRARQPGVRAPADGSGRLRGGPARGRRSRVSHLGRSARPRGKLGMRPLAARCHLALGRLARRVGDKAGARPHLETAKALLETMKMRYWLDRLALDRVSPD